MRWTQDLLYNMDMPNQTRLRWFFLLIAISSTLLGLSFVVMRALTPYDGARLEPGGQAWLPKGVQVSPLTETTGGLQNKDLIIAVEGTPVNELAQSVLSLDSPRPVPPSEQILTYSILRDGRSIEVRAIQTTYPFGAWLARYWGIYIALLSLQIIMTYVLIRRPEEQAAQVLFVFAWSLWHFPAWAMGLQISDIVDGWGFWHYRAVTNLLFLLTFGALLHLGLIFPRRHSILDRIPHLVPIIYLAAYGFFGVFLLAAKLISPNTWIWLSHWNSGEWAVGMLYMFLFIVVTIMNYLNVQDQATRVKIRWVAFGWSVSSIGIVLLWLLPGAILGHPLIPTEAMALITLPLPLALAIAVLRHRLFDIDIVINRALVYGALTTVIVATYAFIVGYVGALFHTHASDHARKDIIFSLIAAGLVAAIFQPMRERLQRAVNRFMYGERDDPYTVLARLGQKLEAAGSADTILPTIVETIAQALKLPYVAIVYHDEGGLRLAASYGTPQPYREIKIPLIHQNASFGDLVLVQRSESESFTPTEERLLTDLAREVEVAAHNVRLTADLQRSRQELVTSREEERRRIRRDLHDEIGPLLASQSLSLDAIEKLIAQDPTAATSLVRDLKGQTQGAVQEIRRIIYDLRPPALDDLGLVEALKERFAQLGQSRLKVELEAQEDIPSLSAAVETAVYRIAVEAVTNVVRHANANECHVSLRVDGNLQLDICDDGVGIPTKHHAGVGLRAMQERAEELGGTFRIERAADIGTRLVVTLPITVEDK